MATDTDTGEEVEAAPGRETKAKQRRDQHIAIGVAIVGLILAYLTFRKSGTSAATSATSPASGAYTYPTSGYAYGGTSDPYALQSQLSALAQGQQAIAQSLGGISSASSAGSGTGAGAGEQPTSPGSFFGATGSGLPLPAAGSINSNNYPLTIPYGSQSMDVFDVIGQTNPNSIAGGAPVYALSNGVWTQGQPVLSGGPGTQLATLPQFGGLVYPTPAA